MPYNYLGFCTLVLIIILCHSTASEICSMHILFSILIMLKILNSKLSKSQEYGSKLCCIVEVAVMKRID